MNAVYLNPVELAITIKALQIIQEQHTLQEGAGNKTLYAVLEKLARAR